MMIKHVQFSGFGSYLLVTCVCLLSSGEALGFQQPTLTSEQNLLKTVSTLVDLKKPMKTATREKIEADLSQTLSDVDDSLATIGDLGVQSSRKNAELLEEENEWTKKMQQSMARATTNAQLEIVTGVFTGVDHAMERIDDKTIEESIHMIEIQSEIMQCQLVAIEASNQLGTAIHAKYFSSGEWDQDSPFSVDTQYNATNGSLSFFIRNNSKDYLNSVLFLIHQRCECNVSSEEAMQVMLAPQYLAMLNKNRIPQLEAALANQVELRSKVLDCDKTGFGYSNSLGPTMSVHADLMVAASVQHTIEYILYVAYEHEGSHRLKLTYDTTKAEKKISKQVVDSMKRKPKRR